MPSYKLTYFNLRARAEVSRYMFKLKKVEFEDERIEGTWKEFKPKTPFGQLPIMEVDGVVICQTLAIERLIAKRLGLYGKDDLEQAKADMVVGCVEDMLQAIIKDTGFFNKDISEEEKSEKKKKFVEEKLKVMLANFEKMMNSDGFFLGKELMWPDISVAHVLSWIGVTKLDFDLSTFSKLQALKERVESQPEIAAWIKVRPESTA